VPAGGSSQQHNLGADDPQRRRTFYIPFTFAIYASFFTVLTSVDTRDPMATKQISIPRGKRRSASKRPRATEVRPRAAQARGNPEDFAEDELSALVVRGCLIARDAVFNVRDFLSDGSRLAFLAIKDCEKELDQIERKIDDQLPEAITRVGEAKARELLALFEVHHRLGAHRGPRLQRGDATASAAGKIAGGGFAATGGDGFSAL